MIIIYCLFKNNVPFYIGKCNKKNIRFSQHKKTYGCEIEMITLDEVEEKDWKFWERHYISLYKSWGFKLENKNLGGGGPLFLSKKSRKKISKNKTGNFYKSKNIPKNKLIKLYKIKSTSYISKYYNVSQPTIINLLKKYKLFIPYKNSPKRSKETKQKQSISLKGKHTKKIYQYNLKGKFLNIFDSMSGACIFLGLNPQKATSSLSECCKGNINTAFGYIWSYSYKKIKLPKKYFHKRLPVLQYDIYGNFIREWKKCSEAEKYYNKSLSSNILACCRKKQKTAYGYVWKYKE